MKIRIRCVTHNAHVGSAGEGLNWIDEGVFFRLDEADLYCFGGDWGHEFEVEIVTNHGNTFRTSL